MQAAPHVLRQLQHARHSTDPSRQHEARGALEAVLRTLEAAAEMSVRCSPVNPQP